MVILCLTVICRVAIFTVFLYVWDRWQLGRSIDGARWDNIQNYLKTRKSKIMRHTCPSPSCCAIASYYNISELTEWQGYHLYLLVRRFMRDANWKNVCQQLWTILKHRWSGSRSRTLTKCGKTGDDVSSAVNWSQGQDYLESRKFCPDAPNSHLTKLHQRSCCQNWKPRYRKHKSHQASTGTTLPKLWIHSWLPCNAMKMQTKMLENSSSSTTPSFTRGSDCKSCNWEISPKISSATKIRWSTELRQDLRLKDVCSRKGPVPPKRR